MARGTSHSPGTKVLVKMQFPNTATERCLVHTLGLVMNFLEFLGNSENPAHWLKSSELSPKVPLGSCKTNDRAFLNTAGFAGVPKLTGHRKRRVKGESREGDWLKSMGKALTTLNVYTRIYYTDRYNYTHIHKHFLKLWW